MPAPTALLHAANVVAHSLVPQEWLRNRPSHWLHEYPVDMRLDDPELIEAMLAL
jgi:hypothetical protein